MRSGSVLRRLRVDDFDLGQLRNRGHHGVAILALQLLGLRNRHLQADGEVVGKVRAADGNRRGVRHRALEKHRQIAGVRADVEQAYAQFALVGRKRALGGGNRLQHRLCNLKPGAVGAGHRALQRAAGAGGDVQIHFKPLAHHAHRIEDAGLVVEDELARQQVQNLAIGGALDGARAIHGGAHIFARNLAHAPAQLDSAIGVQAANVRPAHAHHALVDIGARHALGLLAGRAHRLGRRAQLRDQPLAHSRRLHHAVAAIAQHSSFISAASTRVHALPMSSTTIRLSCFWPIVFTRPAAGWGPHGTGPPVRDFCSLGLPSGSDRSLSLGWRAAAGRVVEAGLRLPVFSCSGPLLRADARFFVCAGLLFFVAGAAPAAGFTATSPGVPVAAVSPAADGCGRACSTIAARIRIGGFLARRHLQHHLVVVAQIHRREMRILLAPLRDVRLIALVTLKEMIFAEVRQNVGALLGHQHARIFGIGQVDLRDLLGVVLAVGVQLRHQPQVHRHARLARLRRVAGIDAGDHRKRIVMLGHGLRRHGEQHAVGVHQADLLAVAREGYRLALDDCDANLIGKQAHHGGVLDPGNLLQLPAPLVQGHKENVAADVFAEDGQHLGAGHLGEPGGLNVSGAGDAEARVALEVVLKQEAGSRQPAEHDERAQRKKHAAHSAGRPPPGPLRFSEAIGGGTQNTVAVRIVELQRHAGQGACRMTERNCPGWDASSACAASGSPPAVVIPQ